MQLQHFLSWNKVNIKYGCKLQLYIHKWRQGCDMWQMIWLEIQFKCVNRGDNNASKFQILLGIKENCH